jgi:hypothetical protein
MTYTTLRGGGGGGICTSDRETYGFMFSERSHICVSLLFIEQCTAIQLQERERKGTGIQLPWNQFLTTQMLALASPIYCIFLVALIRMGGGG